MYNNYFIHFKQTKNNIKKNNSKNIFISKMFNLTIMSNNIDLDEINDEKDSIVFLNRAKLINICLQIDPVETSTIKNNKAIVQDYFFRELLLDENLNFF